MIDISTIHITFDLPSPITVPVHYNHLLQSFIYSLFPQQEAAFIHDQGYRFNGRVYKLFSFSTIQSDKTSYDKSTKKLTFYEQFTISISSIIPNLISKVANYLPIVGKFSIS